MNFLDNIERAKILVIGDVMLDRYWWGTVSRISPEAPVPIVRLSKSSLAAGGAANVAVNIAGLGAAPILVGVVGNDQESELLRQELHKCDVSSDFLLSVQSRPTTVKTRIIAHNQQVARVDQEVDQDLIPDEAGRVFETLQKLIPSVDAIVISDYAKGLLTVGLLKQIIELSHQKEKRVLVDPKGKDYSKYRGAALLTPNRREAAEACNLEEDGPDTINVAGQRLIAEHLFDSVLITQGEDGMTLFQNAAEPMHFAAMARQVYDVTGAGDTVLATLAASIACGACLEDAATAANVAAGIVVEQVGTTSIQFSDLKVALNGR